MSFTHLHTHSEYSFFLGVPKIKELVLKAKELGMTALALTDTNRMSGLIKFYLLCKKNGIKPILGSEITNPKKNKENVVIIAKNKDGYSDLCEIITKRNINSNSFSFINIFSKEYPNLFILTSSYNLLYDLSKTPNVKNLYAELINHDGDSYNSSKNLKALADKLGLLCIATNNVYFISKEDWETHKILTAIGKCSTLSRLRKDEIVPQSAFLCSEKEIYNRFSNNTEAIKNTQHIAEQCNCELELGKWIFPKISVPSGFTPEQYLEKIAYQGLNKKYFGTPFFEKAKEIQEKELAIINKLGFASYFLMVKQIREWANKCFARGYRKPQDCSLMRGSAANSITFYNIGVSDLDPVKYNLYFERFLNEERASPPDADLDFGWDERDAVLEYFVKTWGRDRVAVICTVNHMCKRAAFREVAKIFGFSEEQVTHLFKNGLPKKDPDILRVLEYSKKIVGKPRFLGQHPGGIIVTNEPVWRIVACEYSGGIKNRIITQIDMHSGLDELGLIKFDILGNGSISVLRDTLMQLEEQGYEDPNVWDDSKTQNDPAVLKMIETGQTRGIFYIESPAQIKLNKQALARSFQEIGITSSAVRPAGAKYTKIFVERHRKSKQGIKDWEFLHPSLEPILKETHDCIIYQEDVVKICHQIAGMSFRRADMIRKMMNSNKEGMVEDYQELAMEFIDGCIKKSNLTKEQAIKLWERINSFTGFSFCKSHSLSFAILSFKCAWLKAHYPAQFMASVVSNMHGFYSQDTYLNEARRMGIKIFLPDINKSKKKCYGDKDYIVIGLIHIKGICLKTIEKIINERDMNGPYKNLIDFIRRTKISKSETEKLIKVGCFDKFKFNRAEHIALLDGVYDDVCSFSLELFEDEKIFNKDLQIKLPDYTLMQKCLYELEFLGFMVSGNILDILDLHPESKDAVHCLDLKKYSGKNVKVFGWPITSRLHLVPGRGDMKFITIEDKTGCADIVFWTDVYLRYSDITNMQGPFAVTGYVKESFGTYSVFAHTIKNISWLPSVVDFNTAEKRLADSYKIWLQKQSDNIKAA